MEKVIKDGKPLYIVNEREWYILHEAVFELGSRLVHEGKTYDYLYKNIEDMAHTMSRL